MLVVRDLGKLLLLGCVLLCTQLLLLHTQLLHLLHSLQLGRINAGWDARTISLGCLSICLLRWYLRLLYYGHLLGLLGRHL